MMASCWQDVVTGKILNNEFGDQWKTPSQKKYILPGEYTSLEPCQFKNKYYESATAQKPT